MFFLRLLFQNVKNVYLKLLIFEMYRKVWCSKYVLLNYKCGILSVLVIYLETEKT